MRKGKIRICDVCGKKIQPGGMGGHLRLAHGLVVTNIVTPIPQVTGDIPWQVSDHIPQVSDHIPQVSETIQRPSDYVKKRSAVVEVRKDPIWLASILEGIHFPSISKWQTGSLTEAEKKELAMTAKVMGKSVDEYMKDLEKRISNAHPDIAKKFH